MRQHQNIILGTTAAFALYVAFGIASRWVFLSHMTPPHFNF